MERFSNISNNDLIEQQKIKEEQLRLRAGMYDKKRDKKWKKK